MAPAVLNPSNREVNTVARSALLLLAVQLAWTDTLAAATFERTILERDPKSACPSARPAMAGEPHFALLDERSGRYAMRWAGRGGAPREIIYFCPDRVDVTVSAAVSRQNGKFRYEYTVVSRDTSGQSVYGVALQTFGDEVRVVKPSDDRYVSTMNGTVIPEFAAGKWYRVPYSAAELAPGKSLRIVLESNAPPGLVTVRAHGGPLEMKGVGEEPPSGLEAQLPRYGVWPHGITIGPVADTRSATYPFTHLSLSELVSRMQRAGWLSGEAADRYRSMTKESASRDLAAAVERDVIDGNAAPELRHVMQLLAQAARR